MPRSPALPKASNAMSSASIDGAPKDANVPVPVIWRANGKSWSSGRDVSQLGIRTEDIDNLSFIERGQQAFAASLDLHCPIVCALKGWVIGGSFERSLVADLRICAEGTRFMLPEVKHGVLTDTGGMARLFQMVGHGVTMDLVLTGRVMEADEALRHGVVSRVVPEDELETTAREIAETIAGAPAFTVKMARRNMGLIANGVVQGLDPRGRDDPDPGLRVRRLCRDEGRARRRGAEAQASADVSSKPPRDRGDSWPFVSYPAAFQAPRPASEPDAVAVVCDDGSRRVRRAELEAGANAACASLGAPLGVGPMAIASRSRCRMAWRSSNARWLTWKLGAVPVPLSARLPEKEQREIVALAEPRLVVGVPDGRYDTIASTVCRR